MSTSASSSPAQRLPLEGVRILAVSQFGAGPFATTLLADLGADVVKIEEPRGGDSARYTPPLTIGEGDSLYFQSLNRNKRSVALDLQDPRGQEIFRRMVASAHAVFTNVRGDLPARLGLTYEALAPVNPKIVCCALSGFGTTGPRRAEPGYDNLMQARAAFMALTGDPGGPPTKSGISIVDFATGYTAAIGLLVALYDAERTGFGRDVDVALLDTAVHMLNYLATWSLNLDYRPGRVADSGHAVLVPAQNFATADGTMAVICFKEKFWERLCAKIGRPELAEEARFRRFPDRLAHKEELLAILKPIFATRTTAEWIALLEGVVPCAPVNDLETALAEPQLAARDMIVTVDHPTAGPIRQVGCPIKVGAPPPLRRAPRLGEHGDEILDEIGVGEAERAALREAGVLG